MLDVQKIRSDFPILSRKVNGKPLVYLDNAATSQKPSSVIQGLVDYYEKYNSNIHRGVHTLSMEATEQYEHVRSKISAFIGAAESHSIVFTRNTTESINLVANTWAKSNIAEGDEILITEMEHHSNLVPWQKLAAECGAILKYLPLQDDGALNLSQLDTLLSSRTRLFAFTQMSNVLGTINPIYEMTKAAHRVGAKVLIDAAQGVPHLKVNVQDIGCNFLAFSGHKMLGPTGIGVLYAKRDVLESMEPFLTGGEMVLEVWNDRATWNDLPMRFEAGTPNIADAIALGAAVDYLQDLGMENVRQHEREITEYALARFAELEELDVFGPRDVEVRGGIVSFHSAELHPHDIGTYLDREGVAIRTGHNCTMPLMRDLGIVATARASFYVYNLEEEVDVLVDNLKSALQYFSHGAR